MSTEANKALVRSFYERINQGNLSAVDAYISPRFTDRNAAPDLPTRMPGVEGVKQVLIVRRNAFPDLHYTIEDLLAEGDKVVVHETLEGTHQEDFWGIAPPASASARRISTSSASRTAKSSTTGMKVVIWAASSANRNQGE